LQFASGSASELEYEFLLARDLQLISDVDYQQLNGDVCEIKRMLASLLQKVDADRNEAEC
jgi:four helix bundle protein